MGSYKIRAIAVLCILASAGIVSASDLYTLTATTTSGPPITASVSGSSFLKLVQNAVSSKSEFQSFQGRDVLYTLSYAGKTAMTISRNAAGTTGTVTIPSTGYSKTFTGANAEDLRQQVSHALRNNVDNALGRLNEKLQQRTKVGVIDGNPHAATAMIADDAFYRFALPRTRPDAGAGWWIKGDGGKYSADGLNGTYGDFGIGFDVPFGEVAALSIGFDSQYNQIGGANSFTIAGLDIGVPITIARSPTLDGFTWKATPFGNGFATISPDTLSGGGVYGGGAASSLSYVTGPWAFTLGNQIGYFTGVNLGVEGRVYGNRNLEQWVLKNGLNAVYSPDQHFFIDGGLTYTNFLKKAGVPDYLSPTAGVGWRFNAATQIRIGARGDFANGYTSFGGEVSFNVSY